MSDAFLELARTGKLPSPSGVGTRILSLTQDESATVDDVAEVLARDPALTGRILHVANSAAQARSVPLTTTKEAAMRLGLRSVSSIAVGFTLVSSNQSGICEGFDYAAFWSRSLATAAAAGMLAREIEPALAPEAFTAGLLSDIGRLALATVNPVVYTSVLGSWHGKRTELLALEQKALGIDHAAVAARMILGWGMPSLISGAIEAAARHLPEGGPAAQVRLARILIAADHLGTHHVGKGEPSWQEDAELTSLLEALGIDVLDLAGHMPDIEAEWRELASDLAIKPLPPWDEAGAAREDPAAPKPEGPLILAVDNDPIALKVLTNCLHRAGHRVAPASSGEEALALALQHQPAILITDWQMPGMDGLSLCRALRRCEIGRSLFVIVLSGRDEADACTQAFDAEANDFIQKPFHPRQLIARVKTALSLHAAQSSVANEKEPTAAGEALGDDTERDHQTGLPNRLFATSHLTSIFGSSSKPLSVIALGIDGIAEVSSTLIGQDLTRQLAEHLKEVLRRDDVVTCTASGKFLLLCPGANLLDAAGLADRLRIGIMDAKIGLSGHVEALTVSAGVAERSHVAKTPAALLQLAEAALEMGAMDAPNQVHPAA